MVHCVYVTLSLQMYGSLDVEKIIREVVVHLTAAVCVVCVVAQVPGAAADGRRVRGRSSCRE